MAHGRRSSIVTNNDYNGFAYGFVGSLGLLLTLVAVFLGSRRGCPGRLLIVQVVVVVLVVVIKRRRREC